jgi:type III secretion protein V
LRPHLARVFETLGIRIDVLAIEEIPREVFHIRNVSTFART